MTYSAGCGGGVGCGRVGWLVGRGPSRGAVGCGVARLGAVLGGWGGWAAVGCGGLRCGITLALGRFLLVLLLLLLVETVFIVADDRADLRSGMGRG